MGQPLVQLIEGRLGAGKTYMAMEWICERIAEGGTCVTNIEVLPDGVRDYVLDRFGLEMEPDQLIKLTDEQVTKFWEHSPVGSPDCNVMVVIDEAHTAFKRAAKRRGEDNPVIDAVTVARKQWTDLVFIAPSLQSVDQQLQDYNHFVWRQRDMQKTSLMGISYPIPQFMRRKYDGDGGYQEDWMLVAKDKRIYQTYNTYHIVKGVQRAGRALKKSLKKGKRKLTPMKIILVLVVMVLGLYYGVGHWRKRLNGSEHTPTVATSGSSTSTAAPPSIGPLTQAALPGPTPLPQVQIVTETWLGSMEGYAMRTQEGGTYIVGEMCSYGIVDAVHDRICRIKTLDRRTIFIAPRAGAAPTSFAASLPVVVQPAVNVQAPAVPEPETLSQREAKRIHDNLHTSTRTAPR